MSSENKLISYTGPLKFETIRNLLEEIKIKMDEAVESVVTYKRILNASVELLENILKYSESKQNAFSAKFPVTFLIYRAEDHYKISARNVVADEIKPELSKNIDLVNSMSAEDLKIRYREVISNGQFTEEGGAGLGFIEIAKTSVDKIFYSFESIIDNLSYFTIEITI